MLSTRRVRTSVSRLISHRTSILNCNRKFIPCTTSFNRLIRQYNQQQSQVSTEAEQPPKDTKWYRKEFKVNT
jgi:hypothetical protein